MWFLNHVAAPVVRTLLRSPAHRLLSGSVLLVTYAGRRSGCEVTVPVQYVLDDDRVVVTVGTPEVKQWWRNFREPHPARLLIRRRSLVVNGDVTVDPDGTTRVVFTPVEAPAAHDDPKDR